MGPGEVTQLLERAGRGDRTAFDALFPLVYEELSRMAGRQLGREHGERTLRTQGLVHEAYLRLAGREVDWSSRAHFLAIAARVMRQVLVDAARRRRAQRRGGDLRRVTLSAVDPAVELSLDEVIALDEALERLGELAPRLRDVVEMRFFAGMEEAQVAAALGLSTRTVERDWAKARAWLHKELEAGRGGSSGG